MMDNAEALKQSPSRILLAAEPDRRDVIVIINKDGKFAGKIPQRPPANSKGYEYVRADLYDELKAKYDSLKSFAGKKWT